jgi:major membrane immunogen (membrane-anchored lipoprotein)
MNASRTALMATLAAVMLLGGCVSVSSSVRQKDGTYRTTHHLIWKSTFEDFWSFKCDEDHMVATELDGVTYAWPKGSGSLTGPDSVEFTGRNLDCKIAGRTLTINGREFGEFEEGDLVQINSDGSVLVNDAERTPLATD